MSRNNFLSSIQIPLSLVAFDFNAKFIIKQKLFLSCGGVSYDANGMMCGCFPAAPRELFHFDVKMEQKFLAVCEPKAAAAQFVNHHDLFLS
jgi:hypothetical protein